MSESTEDAIRSKVTDHIRDLLDAHWHSIVEIRDLEEGEVTIGFNVHVQASGLRPILKTKIRYARTFTDEAEEMLPDQNQNQLEIDA